MSLVRFLAAEKDINKRREGFYSIIIFVVLTGLIISFLVYLLSDQLAASIFQDINTSYFIKAGSFLIFLTAIDNVVFFYFRVFDQIRTYALLALLQTFGKLFLILLFLMWGFGLLSMIVASIIVQGAIFALAMKLVVSQIGFAFPSFSMLGEYLRFGAPLTPNILIHWITQSSDKYILGLFLGLNAVGVYSAAYAIGGLIYLFVSPIQFILFPELARMYDENQLDDVRLYMSHSIKYFLLIGIPAASGLSVLAKPLLEILTTPAFVNASLVIPFVAVGALFEGVYSIVINVTHLVKKTKYNFYIQLIAAVTNLGLNLLLIPIMGILGAAIATSISYVVMFAIGCFISFKQMDIYIDIPFVIKSSIAAGIMVALIIQYQPKNLIEMVIAIALGALIYFSSLFLLKGFNDTELNTIKKWIFRM